MWGKKEEGKVSPSPANSVPSSSYQPLAASRIPGSAPELPRPSATPTAAVREPAPVATPHPVEISRPAISSASVISKGLVIKGQVTGSEDLQIEGEVTGSVHMPGARVMITPEGRTTGNIEAREVVIRGKLKGDVLASERVVVGQTGVWQGDSISPKLVIEGGAVVKGRFEVTKAEQKKPAHAPAPAPKAAEKHEEPAGVSAVTEEALATVSPSGAQN
jgi:cytoskeletal protein CcmA (bactofilin family)